MGFLLFWQLYIHSDRGKRKWLLNKNKRGSAKLTINSEYTDAAIYLTTMSKTYSSYFCSSRYMKPITDGREQDRARKDVVEWRNNYIRAIVKAREEGKKIVCNNL